MSAWIEDRADEIRASLGLRDRPGIQCIPVLEIALAGVVEFCPWEENVGAITYWPDKKATIWYPQSDRRPIAIGHELGHLILRHGLGSYLRLSRCASWRVQQMKEECAASRFCRALLIPTRLAASDRTDWEVAEECAVPVEMVQQRRRDLARRRP